MTLISEFSRLAPEMDILPHDHCELVRLYEWNHLLEGMGNWFAMKFEKYQQAVLVKCGIQPLRVVVQDSHLS